MTKAQKQEIEELVNKRLGAVDTDIQKQLEDAINEKVKVLYGV